MEFNRARVKFGPNLDRGEWAAFNRVAIGQPLNLMGNLYFSKISLFHTQWLDWSDPQAKFSGFTPAPTCWHPHHWCGSNLISDQDRILLFLWLAMALKIYHFSSNESPHYKGSNIQTSPPLWAPPLVRMKLHTVWVVLASWFHTYI